jgi:FtsP/CotA-like multicopper oxidase with cupredoxin domain
MLHDLDCRAAVRKTAGRRCRSWVPRMVLGPLLGSPSSVRLIWRLEGLFFAALCFLAPATSSRAEEPSDCTAVSRTSQNYPAHVKALIEKYGGEEFRNPVSVRPTTEATKYDIVVHYAANRIMGCDVKVRSYNGKLVGDTIRARPGDTLHLRLINAMPQVADGVHKHPQDPAPGGHAQHFNLNITNLHTHGLNTAPQGPKEPGSDKAQFESDNALIELRPGEQQEYRIHIHEKHPAGTFWYHAHVHGSTALQLASGMAGALIIEEGTSENGDLDVLPEIKIAKATEKVFVLQQFGYDRNGVIETGFFGARPTTINGQLVPKIHMRAGEVQRWRFIHAGTQENIAIALDGHPLHEVASDGISLGRSVEWPDAGAANVGPIQSKLVLSPGYRTDVLIKAQLEPGQTSRRIFLRDLGLPNEMSLVAAETINLHAISFQQPEVISGTSIEIGDKPEQVLAEIIIEGPPVTMELPTENALANVKPVDLTPLTDDQLQQNEAQLVQLQIGWRRICDPDGSCVPCPANDLSNECRKLRYLLNGRQFSDTNVRTLKLGSAAEWTLVGLGIGNAPDTDRPQRHPFHIHVNPFYYQRQEPSGAKNWVWKDTLLVPVPGSPPGTPEKVRMRYTRFTGKFVIHCHILNHEDRGMMQLVEIVP